MDDLKRLLETFQKEHGFRSKGPLSVALVVTRNAREAGFPLDPARLVTEGGGQVLGLGKSAVQGILRSHGINRVLAREGGRTSRGSLGNMRDYVDFLNALHKQGLLDLERIEAYWVQKVREYFASQPFHVRWDRSLSLRSVVRDLLDQAKARQKESSGSTTMGAVLQHLVGAKLQSALPNETILHHSYSTADAPSDRQGDFEIASVAIHVTTSPSESLIEKCRQNLDAGFRPLIITLQPGVTACDVLAENAGISGRIDVFEVEQFIACNLHELGGFQMDSTTLAVRDLVDKYNEIVSNAETDPSLRITIRG